MSEESTIPSPFPAGSDAGLAGLGAGIADPLFQIDSHGVISWANQAAETLFAGHSNQLIGASATAVFPDAFGAIFSQAYERAVRSGVPVEFEEQYLPRHTWLEVHIYPQSVGTTVLIHDTAHRRRDTELVEDHAEVLEKIARGQPYQTVLEAITGLVEHHGDGFLAAVCSVDQTQRQLRSAVGPSLPPAYLHAVDGLEVCPDGSPIAQSLFRLKPIVIADLQVEPSEPTFREAALRHGLRACWAVPIISTSQVRLGVLVVYRRETGSPTEGQLRLLQTAANLTGIALERQLKEADLRQKEQEYRSIVETVQDALIVADARGYIAEVNPAASRLHGSSYDDLLGKQAMELVRADYHAVVRRMLDEVRQGREYRTDMVCIRRDGSSFPAEVNAVPFVFKDQQHLLAVVRDASHRKKMEDSLRRTEERLRTVANGAPLVLFSLDKAGIFTLSEGQALSAIGLRPGEVVGRSAFEIYAHDAAIVQNLKVALAGEPRRFTIELSERVFETIVRPLRSHRGEIVGAVGVAIDITEQTLTEEALAESEERFRAAFHQAPIGAAHTSLDGIVLRANEPLAAMLGVTPQEIVGRRLQEWFTEEQHRAADDTELRALRNETAGTAAIRMLRGVGDLPFRAVVSLSVVRGKQGEAKHLVYAVTPLPGETGNQSA